MHVLVEKNIISINLSDNGVGFDMLNRSNKGIGLRNLENRVKKMRASHYTLDSKPNKGLLVNLVLDLNSFKESDYI